MIKKLLLISLFVSGLFAATTAVTPTKYEVTFKKLELKKSDGTYIVMWEGTEPVDIAESTGAGVVGGLVSDYLAPDGIYTHIRATFSTSIVVSGCLSAGKCTKNDTWNYGAAKADSTAAEVTLKAHATNTTMTGEYALSFSVENGICTLKNRGLTINFDVVGALTHNDDMDANGASGTLADQGFVLGAPAVTLD